MSVSAADHNQQGQPVPPATSPAPAAAARSEHGWVWQVTALSVAMGVMLALAINTTSRVRESADAGSRLGVSAAFLSRFQDQNARLEQELRGLRERLDRQMAEAGDDSRATETLKQELDALKAEAGLTEVEGPGLRITVADSATAPPFDAPLEEKAAYMVHDQDLNFLIGELKAAGAKHLAVSGADPDNLQRVVVTTTARCVGPTAQVNGVPLAAPYHIMVVGDPRALRAALERPESYVQTRRLKELKMVTIEDADRLVLPGYSGPLQARYARPTEDDPDADAKSDAKAGKPEE